MFRSHAQLLTALCVFLAIVCFLPITSRTQGSQHSLLLNGTNSYVSVPNSASINISGPITIEAWIKVNAITSGYQEIVYRHSWQVPGTGGGYEFSITNTGKLRLDLYQSHNQYTTAIGSTTIITGTWHHVAGVWDGNQMRLYLNGMLDGSLWTTNGPAAGNSPLKIGLNTGGSYYFGGLIDEVRISAAALYSSNFSPGLGPANNTRAWWKFDGQTVNDFSGNGNHGTLQGGATYSTNIPPATGGSQRPVPIPGGPYNSQLAQSVQFSSSGSFDPDGTITAYHWNFGDGTSSNAANPTHTYQSSGLFTATLTVTDNAGLLASATIPVSINGSSEARLDPRNATGGSGENPLSRNFNWSLPLVSLPGRSGLDLNLSLSYNSLVWTKKGTTLISFDDDRGFPSPGFRLGFPTIHTAYLNAETNEWSYLLIGSDGGRTELRRVTTTSVFYESADSSHLLLDTTGLSSSDPKMILRTTDGTQLTYKPMAAAYECTEINDRNGNYLTINYNSSGRIANIRDTLDRTITFVYENGWLKLIEQQWKKPSNPAQQITHTWASFAYTNVPIQTNFTAGVAVSGPANGTSVKMLATVTLDDHSTTPSLNSHYDFEYTSWGQVWKINNFAADNHLLNYRSYKLPGSPLWPTPPAQADCPRFTERRDWAEQWNQNVSGIEQEAVTTYTGAQSGTASVPGNSQNATFVQVTNPDQTFTKIYFLGTAGTASGWRVGLPYLVESYDVGDTSPQRQTATTWTQDDESKSYILNPRVKETNVYDASGNRKRTEFVYQSFSLGNGMNCNLPQDVREYDANASTVLRTTRTIYIDDAPYLGLRIIGLPKESLLYEGTVNSSNLRSKREFIYDEAGSIDGNDAPVQHDPAYSSSFVSGRGNVSTVKRYNVNNLSEFTSSTMKYNTAGAVVSSKDALNHESKISYADSFSDGVSRNTFAYPTKLTDADGYYSTSKYNYDFGAVTYQQTPPPNFTGAPSQQPAGPEQTFEYYDHGPLKKQLNLVNNAYTRFEYASSQIRVDTYATIQEGLGEAHSFKLTDGHGRVIATATDHPGSVGGFSGQKFVYDVMGHVIKTSNPTETSASGTPSQWTTAGDDAAAGWIYAQQTYDWKGRLLVTTNQDGTTRTASYSGCGCAGGEVITLTDEGTIDGGMAKRRQQKLYSDVLGRTFKTEVLNWEGGSEYSTIVNTFNVRDQVTRIRQYAGAESSGTYQDTTMTYDGFGRLKTSHAPHQQPEPNNNASSDQTTFFYNADDTLSSLIDARGVVKTLAYNNRRMVTAISHDLGNIPPAYNHVAPTADITLSYDAVGNRLAMTDGSGSTSYEYNHLGQLSSETRQFAGALSGASYTLNYQYNLGGQLKKITDHTNTTINYNYSRAGQLSAVTGENNLVAGVATYATAFAYRAWGALSNVNFGNGTTQQTSFNSRLLPTSSSVGNVFVSTNQNATMSWSYDYYADALLRRAFDASDDRFDRMFEFDHAGRLKEAYSGREARGLAPSNPADSPYRHSFQYNAFGNRIQKSGRFWRTEQSGPTPCTPRQTNDGCDAEGNVLNHNSSVHTYDAAGRQVNFVNWRQTVGGTPNHPDLLPGLEIVQTYNGDGRPATRMETRRSEELISGGPNTNVTETVTTTYYIYSSVLGGAKVVELDASGNKVSGYVYANGTRLAKQEIQATLSTVTWHHPNPGTNSWLETGGGREARREEMDPDGAEVGTEDPWANILVGGAPTYEKLKEEEPLYIEGGDPFDYSEGHTIDGLPVSATEFNRRMRNGSVGGQLSVGGIPVVFLTNQQQLDYITFDVFEVDAEMRNLPQSQRWGGTYFKGTLDFNVGQNRSLNRGGRFPGGGLYNPQKRGFDIPEITRQVNAILSKQACIDFAKRILNAVSTKDNPVLRGGNLQDIFTDFLDQKKGGYTRVKPRNSAGYGSPTGLISKGNGKIFSGAFTSMSDSEQTAYDAGTTVAELFHMAGRDEYYTDRALAEAVHNIPEYAKMSRFFSPTVFDPDYEDKKGAAEDPNHGGWSSYFHDIERQLCGR